MNQSITEEEEWSMAYPADGSMPGAFAGPDSLASDAHYSAPESYEASQPSISYPQLQAPQASAPQGPAAIPLSALQRPQQMRRSFGQSDNQLQSAAVALRKPSYYRPDQNPDFKSRGHMLGFATVAVGLGAVLGARLGGVYGGIAGTLFAGAATNGYRALLHGLEKTPEGKREALISGTWSVVAAGAGGYLLYMTRKRSDRSEMTPNRSDDDDSCATKNGRRSCGIRAII